MQDLIAHYIDRILAQSTPQAPLWNMEKTRQGSAPRWNYVDGCMMTSLLSLYEQTGEERFFRFVEHFIDYYVSEDGSMLSYALETYNLDNICEGRVLFDLYRATGKEKYRRAIALLHRQLTGQPLTTEGNFWQKLIYPHQVWLDGLYMAQVFAVRYENAFAQEPNYTDIVRQFQNVRDIMFDQEKKLYYHRYDSAKRMFWANEKGLSKSFWLRAVGWFAVALVDVISYLPQSAKEERAQLSMLLNELIEGIVPYINEDTNMLYQVVNQAEREGNYPETSGSSMIAYAMLKGARRGALPVQYRATGTLIFEGICRKYLSEKDGMLNLGGICLSAGLGPENNNKRDGTYEYYIAEPVLENDAKGAAPFLMCYVELQAI